MEVSKAEARQNIMQLIGLGVYIVTFVVGSVYMGIQIRAFGAGIAETTRLAGEANRRADADRAFQSSLCAGVRTLAQMIADGNGALAKAHLAKREATIAEIHAREAHDVGSLKLTACGEPAQKVRTVPVKASPYPSIPPKRLTMKGR